MSCFSFCCFFYVCIWPLWASIVLELGGITLSLCVTSELWCGSLEPTLTYWWVVNGWFFGGELPLLTEGWDNMCQTIISTWSYIVWRVLGFTQPPIYIWKPRKKCWCHYHKNKGKMPPKIPPKKNRFHFAWKNTLRGKIISWCQLYIFSLFHVLP